MNRNRQTQQSRLQLEKAAREAPRSPTSPFVPCTHQSLVEFKEWRMPDGSIKGRRAWRAVQGETVVVFYAIGRGRKSRYYVTWDTGDGNSGGQQTESFHGAQKRAEALLIERGAL